MRFLKQLFARSAPPKKQPAPPAPEPDPEAIQVPEMTVADLRAALAGGEPPLLLDVRESYEWRQVRIPGAMHMPMNSVPGRLPELPKEQPIVVLCAHGSRSFGVTHYLREQGYDAINLKGGITQWHVQGGAVEQ
jgi:rhodanese-related sulfurtransferase